MTRRELLFCGVPGAISLLAGCAAAPGAGTGTAGGTDAAVPAPSATEEPHDEGKGDEDVDKFELEMGGRTFSGTFALTDAGAELAHRLPLTLTMKELAGNEKYFFTGRDFPGDEETPSELHAGEIWIYSGDCVVLFYEDHPNTGYSYKPAGSLDDPSGLAEAVGAGDVKITLR